MKRGFVGRGVLAQAARALLLVAALCSFAFDGSAQSAPAGCAARTAKLLWVESPSWRSNEIVSTSTGGRLPIADCATSLAQANLRAGDIALVENFTHISCTGATADVAGITRLDVPQGACATYTTEAIYTDQNGALNVITIPELAAPIELRQSARFNAIQNDGDRSTFFAIFPAAGGSTRLAIRTFDGAGSQVGEELVSAHGFTFYELQATARIGSVVIENRGSQVGPELGAAIDVAAFAGYRSGGGPRVILPERLAPTP